MSSRSTESITDLDPIDPIPPIDHSTQARARVLFYVTAPVRDLTAAERRIWPAYCYTCVERCAHRDGITGRTVTVPVGFLCDGSTASPDWGGYSWLVHDWLYAVHRYDDGTLCTRKEADAIMYDILRSNGMFVYAEGFLLASESDVGGLFSSAWESSGRRGPEFLLDKDQPPQTDDPPSLSTCPGCVVS